MIPRAEFFDVFGLGTFGFITGLALWGLWTGQPLPSWTLVALLFIGIAGLLVDGTIVYKTYFRKQKSALD